MKGHSFCYTLLPIFGVIFLLFLVPSTLCDYEPFKPFISDIPASIDDSISLRPKAPSLSDQPKTISSKDDDHNLDEVVASHYDPESDLNFPVTRRQVLADSDLVAPPLDTSIFSANLLEELATHCDDPIPTYWEFISKAHIAFAEMGFNFTRYPYSSSFYIRLLRALSVKYMTYSIVIGIAFTLLRYLLTAMILKPLIVWLCVPDNKRNKLLECIWKTICFTALWLFSLYVNVLSGRQDFFYPLHIFKDLKVEPGYFEVPLPTDIFIMYLIQLGYYMHCLYSVVFLDTWVRDTPVLIVHHLLTLFLMTFSMTAKLHRIGALVLFLHDISDIFLEFGKVNVYLKLRNGRFHRIHDIIANICCALFISSWAYFRLYLFPLKVIYTSTWGVYITQLGREARCFLFFNFMLLSLLAMHIYWFYFILLFGVRMLTGQQKTVRDIRDYEDEDIDKETERLKALSKNNLPNGINSDIQ